MKISRLVFAIVALIWSIGGIATADSSSSLDLPITPDNLKPWLESVRVRNGVPALAVAVVYDGRITSVATGFRKYDNPTQVTDEDSFHLGSCTKSMTATMLAFLVQDNKVKWSSTIAEIFPELSDSMCPQYRTTTLRQLLNHRAGMPAETWPAEKGNTYWRASTLSLSAQRLEYVKAILVEPPTSEAGSKFVYSNRDYILAGTIAERVSGETWEQLMHEKVFGPLDMKSAAFGPTSSEGKVDGVWSHYAGDEKLSPTSGPLSDNPPMAGPAATVHCTLEDWGKYILFHLRGVRGEGTELSKENFAALYTPPEGGDYAFGWKIVPTDWGGGDVLQHNGTNMGNFCVVWVVPKLNYAVMVATNTGDGYKVCNEVATDLALELGKH